MKLVAVILATALVALSASGCGGSSAGSVVSETTQNLEKIHSGHLDLKLMITPHGGGEPFGFELKGPFSLRPGKLPIARVTYTRTANGTSASATFVSDGTRAWVVSRKGARSLTAAQAAPFQGATKSLSGSSGGLSAFDVGAWLKHPTVSDAGTIDGAATERINGDLDIVAAANGLMGFAALAGRNAEQIMGSDATRLQEALRRSSVHVLTGKDDRLLRRLAMSADLAFDVPAALKNALGTRVGTKIDFLLAVDRPNSAVVVHGP